MKFLLLTVFSTFAMCTYAQTYEFSVSTGTYQDLTASTSINNGLTWDDPKFGIPIGFDFQYYNTIINEIFIDGYGSELITDTVEVEKIAFLFAYGADIVDRAYDWYEGGQGQPGSLSPLSYQVEGAVGSRICKIEWKNVGFYADIDDDNVSTDFTNFQLWLYEGTNNIEIHFGPKSITQPILDFEGASGAFIGIYPEIDFDIGEFIGEGMYLSGNPTDPNVIVGTDLYEDFLDGAIPDGTIYSFTNTFVGLSDVKNSPDVTIYPNPSDDLINFSFDNNDLHVHSVNLTNLSGQLVLSSFADQKHLDISDLSAGIYLVEIMTNTGVMTTKFIKE